MKCFLFRCGIWNTETKPFYSLLFRTLFSFEFKSSKTLDVCWVSKMWWAIILKWSKPRHLKLSISPMNAAYKTSCKGVGELLGPWYGVGHWVGAYLFLGFTSQPSRHFENVRCLPGTISFSEISFSAQKVYLKARTHTHSRLDSRWTKLTIWISGMLNSFRLGRN